MSGILVRLYRATYKLLPHQRIPKLPRGLYSSVFEGYERDDGRVLARLGARDPKGVGVMMKRAGVDTVDELVEQLEHFEPERDFKRRVSALICSIQNATPYHPHRREVLATGREERRDRAPERFELKQRLKRAITD